MTLVPPQPDYQFIQNSTPSNPKQSDWWLDTSTSPPKSKVYDGSSFVRPEEVEFVDDRVSNAGSSQSELADGADESDGRWRTLFDGFLGVSQPRETATQTSGGTIQFANGMLLLTGNSNGDGAGLTCGGYGDFPSVSSGSRSVLIKCEAYFELPIADLDDEISIGQVKEFAYNTTGADNIAVFQPHIGNSTVGNVVVDNGGTDTNGSVNYPTLTEVNTFTVLIDYAGNYLTAGHTGFYVNGDPRMGDSPDVDLSATPQPNSGRLFGLGYNAAGDESNFHVRHLEVATR